MRAGTLDRIIQLREKRVTKNEFQEPVETWFTQVTLPASKKSVRGDERFSGDQTVASMDTIFSIRYMPGITSQNRIVCEGIEYDIVAPVELGRREGLELYCKSRTD